MEEHTGVIVAAFWSFLSDYAQTGVSAGLCLKSPFAAALPPDVRRTFATELRARQVHEYDIAESQPARLFRQWTLSLSRYFGEMS